MRKGHWQELRLHREMSKPRLHCGTQAARGRPPAFSSLSLSSLIFSLLRQTKCCPLKKDNEILENLNLKKIYNQAFTVQSYLSSMN